MIRKILGNVGACWRTLVVADLLFKAISVVLLVPLVSLLFQLFLALSGRSMLADTDIALFLLHPIGWIAWVMVGGAIVCLFTLEQAVLMTICIGAERRQPGSAGSVFRFVAARSAGLMRLASRVMGYLGLMAVPFLVAGPVVFWLLLSEHDINYYLSNRPVKYWIALAVIGSILLVMTGLMAIHNGELEDHVEITAHRGGAAAAPENTLAAIRRAILDGADWVEIDVQETKDGVVVVAHDSDLMKVARNPVKIWEATADELRAIDIGSFFSGEFASERVPTLEEVLTVCKGKVGVNIELKYYGHDQELEKRVVELVERHEMQSEIVIMSLKQSGIAKMKALRPEWTVGLLTAVAAGDLTLAEADFLAVNSSLADQKFVRSAHRRGKAVSVWTVNDEYEMSSMISRGVDNLITDRPDLARKVLAERQGMSPLERLMVELAFYLGIRPESPEPG